MDELRITKLKKLYELENLLIHYYKSQLSESEDTVFNSALTKFIKTDTVHADYFHELFREQDIEIPVITAAIADITGNLVGEAVELTGIGNVCRIGVSLENQIAELYADLIEENPSSKILDILLSYKIDKEFHALWLQRYGQFLKQQKTCTTNLIQNAIDGHPTVNMNVRLI
ncbi:hypothetical protein LPY66_17575 [Dehalobacter sp. DCM]|uniref:hypothetical protein n=1 Tax=Dehalobacter sp. DCM TaxID=2907827 RepID=UPI0030818F49|nr:hypothetical protein LPY66_17575 [Dehalobacter sp. DCM]